MDRLTAMHVFVTIVEQGSLSRAAENLDMSRAKVSRYLTELESWMDVRLLHRTTRRLSLTTAGEQTLEVAHQLLGLTQTLDDIRNQNTLELKGQLRITASYSLIDSFLMKVVRRFVSHWPQTAIDILATDDSVNLIDSRIDLAVRITNDLQPNVVARRIGECRSIVCAAPEYLQKRGKPTDAQSLVHHNCLSFAYFGRSAWVFDGPNGPESVPISGNISANIPEVLLDATLNGHGISLQPLGTVQPLIESGQLIVLLPEWQPKTLGVYVIYATRKQVTPLQRQFMDFLAEEMQRSPYW
ncbi:LysR family transcriptional regulator [Psychrobacter aquaticus]|uniref:LysR-family transcriptional regulator clustered with n=1 Tax=Psychrobacter aquaticus CMS 56 TaxID=1354303 RepID=U4T388_9GAMM|nr:LysR family transcriptional regulator [Psychrobacter aquaticus]ERL55175.1 LysR-family transcriptional regulator clustered with [Psychrobacter aquaticus CMS 56]